MKSAPGTRSGESRAYPPFVPSWDKNRPQARRTLMRRSFDGGRLVVLFIMSAEEGAPMVVVNMWSGGTEWYAYRGHHEICLWRDRNRLILKRWSHSEHCAKHWVVLKFDTWEGESVSAPVQIPLKSSRRFWIPFANVPSGLDIELVLFHCAFMVLKARNEFTVTLRPKEFSLRGEKTLFQA